MKTTSKLIIVVLAFLALTTSAYAQSPREQLSQMVEQLQKTPTDNALREKLIKLAQEVKPAPAVPEDARRLFIRGNTAMGDAKGAEDYARAAQFYRDASLIAPWWGDPYFNLAKASELKQDYAGALAALRLFVLSGPPAEDARKAQDYVYVLEERRDRQAKVEDARRQVQAREGQNRGWAKDLVEGLQRKYGNPITLFEICPTCSDEEAKGSSWHKDKARWAGRNYRFVFGLTGCGTDQISMYYSFPDFTATRYCGTVSGPNIADVKWAWGGRPSEMKFFDKSITIVEECEPVTRRCKRTNWLFE